MTSWGFSHLFTGATIKHLPGQSLAKLLVALPTLDVQRLVADRLSALDNLIANNRRRIKLLEDSVRRLFDEWFVRLRFPGCQRVAILNGVPNEWQRLPLEQVLFLQSGFDLPIQDREEGPVPIYGASGINGFHNMAKVPGPGVVTGRAGSLGVVQFESFAIDVYDQIGTLQRQNQQLSAARDLLLPRLMSGQLTV